MTTDKTAIIRDIASAFSLSDQKAEEIYEYNKKAMNRALLQMKIVNEGAVIRKAIINGEEWFCVMGEFTQESNIPVPKEYECAVFCKFKTERGALGWCKRKKAIVKLIDKENVYSEIKNK